MDVSVKFMCFYYLQSCLLYQTRIVYTSEYMHNTMWTWTYVWFKQCNEIVRKTELFHIGFSAILIFELVQSLVCLVCPKACILHCPTMLLGSSGRSLILTQLPFTFNCYVTFFRNKVSVVSYICNRRHLLMLLINL